jgi:hypothetical protein
MTSGVAANIPATAYIVHGNRYNTTTVSHEMGHCLGLYHTHHGTDCVHHSYPCESGTAELVNGSNAATGGDYIADTPADPRFWDGCTYNGGGIRDANNQIYNPNPLNYMAYSLHTCRSMFTPMQIQRMKDFIVNTEILKNVVALPVITGPSTVCHSSTATFTVSNAPTGYTWACSGNLTKVSSSGNTATFAWNGTGGSSGWVAINVGTTQVAVKTVDVGSVPVAANISVSIDCESGYRYAAVSLSGRERGIDMYDWRATTGSLTVAPHPLIQRIIPVDPVQITGINGGVEVRAHNTCGWSDWKYVGSITSPCPGSYYSIVYPNPASDILNIEINEAAVAEMQAQAAMLPAATGG